MGNCVSLSLDQLLIHACGCFFGDGNYIHMMEANLEALQKTMKELEQRQADMLRRVDMEEDKGLKRLAQVQGWFSKVEGIGPQVNDLLQARATETRKLCMFGYFSKDFISSYDYGEKVFKKLKEVEGLLSKGVFEVLADKIPPSKGEKKHIKTTIGLDSVFVESWNCLIKDGPRTLGLYGMGGVGKTTLLARINNKFVEEVNEFDVVIWVDVSKDLQNESIQKQILKRLRLDKEWEHETEEEKASSIHNNLKRKKFVLLLDDLWSEVDLIKIGVPPVTLENGSKIVFTTRSKEVCKDMNAGDEEKLDCLSPDEAWELFKKTVGEVPLMSHQDIPAIARKVAEKCCGLPLALCVIGKAMACKETVQEWRHAINVLNKSGHEFPGMETKILPILKFSYDSLKDEKAKLCFRYCSLFPKHYGIKNEELIEYWMCEGFLDGNGDEDGPINQGHDIIGSLRREHLLMDCQFSREEVKMHDVIREMALWIDQETHCVRSGAKLRQIPKDIKWEIVRRISLMSNQIEELSCSPKCPNLSTLLLRNNKLVSISGEFFRFMPALVVLDLSENKELTGLPEDISNLGSLLYLNLSDTRIKSLPVGLTKLRKLIDLNLECAHELESIDGIATSFPNLQVLKLLCSGVYVDERSIKELQRLEHLTLLTATIKDAKILEQIQGVERLASSIRALCLRYISAEVIKLNAVAMGGLEHLSIHCSKISEIKIDWENNEIWEVPGFKQLFSVDIEYLEGPMDLTWLLFAQNLRDLCVEKSPNIEDIINKEKGMSITEVHPHIGVPFGKLELLHLRDMVGLKRISLNPPALPSLKSLIVKSCPELPKAATVFPRS
ncbi:P-loop containing nucleoside triphosphate hydrolase [Arabidopsis suecica]|uniref:P-loop containing nucleoside triphosphate hydrolase n=1 Tax=Arabidopsis suecica TaxID=45249 RepID=A0A8T1YNK8_ARASU|nr:P-loop containing nucleoside triphosphate hydrolase [Arabidopsis suecica]